MDTSSKNNSSQGRLVLIVASFLVVVIVVLCLVISQSLPLRSLDFDFISANIHDEVVFFTSDKDIVLNDAETSNEISSYSFENSQKDSDRYVCDIFSNMPSYCVINCTKGYFSSKMKDADFCEVYFLDDTTNTAKLMFSTGALTKIMYADFEKVIYYDGHEDVFRCVNYVDDETIYELKANLKNNSKKDSSYCFVYDEKSKSIEVEVFVKTDYTYETVATLQS